MSLASYNPLKKFREWQAAREGSKVVSFRPDAGMISAHKMAIVEGENARAFLDSHYHISLMEWLGFRAERALSEAREGKITWEAYNVRTQLIQDVSEHAMNLVSQGERSLAKLSEWDEQGLTTQVAAADAELAKER